ncbi:unnamed protein product [Nesidiocoris tenuis]|uniref:Uncharacterized protein n=1 Tax=Nesidiocoris tenuis TaxID=355587 RepID=A0A6H5GYL7_9HEMI|nr:unnamed protein product [Nesidiocoris tenuis]
MEVLCVVYAPLVFVLVRELKSAGLRCLCDSHLEGKPGRRKSRMYSPRVLFE